MKQWMIAPDGSWHLEDEPAVPTTTSSTSDLVGTGNKADDPDIMTMPEVEYALVDLLDRIEKLESRFEVLLKALEVLGGKAIG